MAVDALWGGTPVLTWGNGVDMGGRVGASILTTLLSPVLRSYLIANDDADYITKAVRLANDKILHAKLRDTLLKGGRYSSSSHLNRFWNTSSYVYFLERGFEMIWKRFQSGLEPDHVRRVRARDNISTYKTLILVTLSCPSLAITPREYSITNTRTQVRVHDYDDGVCSDSTIDVCVPTKQ